MSCDSYLAAFGAKRTSASGCLTIAVYEYTHQVVLTTLVVFSTTDLFDDRLRDLIPMLCLAAVTSPDGDFGTTKDIGPLAETDPFIASGDVATLAKIAALIVKPGRAASHECFAPMCELLHTVSANQTCNSTILLLGQFWDRPRSR